jgi:hypothetical protein
VSTGQPRGPWRKAKTQGPIGRKAQSHDPHLAPPVPQQLMQSERSQLLTRVVEAGAVLFVQLACSPQTVDDLAGNAVIDALAAGTGPSCAAAHALRHRPRVPH